MCVYEQQKTLSNSINNKNEICHIKCFVNKSNWNLLTLSIELFEIDKESSLSVERHFSFQITNIL